MKLFYNLFVKPALRVIFSNRWHNVAILQVKEKEKEYSVICKSGVLFSYN